MKKLLCLAILTLTACIHDPWKKFAPHVAFAAPNKSCSVTERTATFGDPVVDLQIATAGATELRTWPGTATNYQKAEAEWRGVDELLSADIATRNMNAYRRHIAQLARTGPVTKANEVCLVRMSFAVSAQR